MQSISTKNKGNRQLLFPIDFFSKYGWVFPLNGRRGISIVNTFQKIISKDRKQKNMG